MSERSVEWLARIAASAARVQAMMALNEQRARIGASQGYGEQCFWDEADILEAIAKEAAKTAGGGDE